MKRIKADFSNLVLSVFSCPFTFVQIRVIRVPILRCTKSDIACSFPYTFYL
jgi:hypothetical protein